MEVKEQCVWCDYYYPTTTSETTMVGQRGSGLSFGFTYTDQAGRRLTSYDFIVTAENVPNPESATNKITGTVSGTSILPNTPVVISGFSMMTGNLSGTTSLKQIPYTIAPNNNYYLWVRLTNDLGQSSIWIKSNNPFGVSDHKWPKVSMVSAPITVNAPTQFCSTVINSSDPCLSLCWVKSTAINGVTNMDFSFSNTFLRSQQLQSSSWKCSVCYNNAGQAILCQDAPKKAGKTTNFDWSVVDPSASLPPVLPTVNPSNVPSWWGYGSGQANDSITYNPVVQFRQQTTNQAKAKLRIYGSECPLEASVSARTIRPVWVEK
ncbi:MAG: hypothetical protein BWY21_02274 [Parcubacteria group bacterium ADurb.Bin216]|nr:MAG: hypothetical protein BWY21_02274 [Parcubacteria group bacterium ADurb.Bin216]